MNALCSLKSLQHCSLKSLQTLTCLPNSLQLRDYEKQLREQQIKRMEEIEKQRAMHREEEKRQKEHEAALDKLRNQRAEGQRKDLETLQV